MLAEGSEVTEQAPWKLSEVRIVSMILGRCLMAGCLNL